MTLSIYARFFQHRLAGRAHGVAPSAPLDRPSIWAERPSYEPPAHRRLYLWVPHLR